MSVNYAWPLPEVNWTNTVRDLYRLWAACPCLPWSAVAMRVLTWVVFTLSFFHADIALQQQPFTNRGLGTRISKDIQCLWNILNALYGIWLQVSKKQTYTHTHIYACSVGLAEAHPNTSTHSTLCYSVVKQYPNLHSTYIVTYTHTYMYACIHAHMYLVSVSSMSSSMLRCWWYCSAMALHQRKAAILL